MKTTKDDKAIPEQRVGSKLDVDHEYLGKSEGEARSVFSMASSRLLNVNIWDKLCGPLSAKFILTDANGHEANRPARAGDHFKIDVPGPGPNSGGGYDWVEVEIIEDRRNPDGADESMTMRVRPSSSPQHPSTDTAHFFDASATSSFRVFRTGRTVKAEVHGRNEIPNTEAEKTTDKIRNAMVGSSAKAGLSVPQWKSLVKGLLDRSIDVM